MNVGSFSTVRIRYRALFFFVFRSVFTLVPRIEPVSFKPSGFYFCLLPTGCLEHGRHVCRSSGARFDFYWNGLKPKHAVMIDEGSSSRRYSNSPSQTPPNPVTIL